MKNLIKIIDRETALKLEERGFCYMLEKINKGQDVYVFKATEDLMKALTETFASTDFYEDKTLKFGGGG